MAESIDSMRRERLAVSDIPTDLIQPDPANPNTVSDELMEALRADIVKRGFVQPVVVRPEPGKEDRYLIVDGEHRWKVLKAAGAETIPCVIDIAGEDDGRLRMLTMNRLRGEFVPVRMAGILARLAGEMDEDELTERLGMDDDEYTAVMAAESAGADVNDRLAAALQREQDNAPEVLTWKFSPEQAATVEAAIIERMVAGAKTRADALIEMLEPSEE